MVFNASASLGSNNVSAFRPHNYIEKDGSVKFLKMCFVNRKTIVESVAVSHEEMHATLVRLHFVTVFVEITSCSGFQTGRTPRLIDIPYVHDHGKPPFG